MIYKYAYLNTLVFLHYAFMLSVVRMPLKGEVGGCTLNSHGNYIVDHGKIIELCFFNFCENPAMYIQIGVITRCDIKIIGIQVIVITQSRPWSCRLNKN